MIELEFPDKSKQKFKEGITPGEIAKGIGQKLARDALAAKLDDRIIELNAPLNESGKFRILTWEDAEGKQALWHTAAHVLNEAVKEIFPNAKPTIGPPIEQGFYYDFDSEKPFTPEDLEKIEKKMAEIIKQDKELKGKQVSAEEAKKIFADNQYKKELIEEFAGEGKKLTVYYQGQFCDLCRGGHADRTGKIKAAKLLKTSGAYWRGSEKNKMLQRICGIAFPQQKMLEEFLNQKEEAEKRNHLKLGKQLELFTMQEESPGSVFWLPKGMVVYNALVGFMRKELLKLDYREISTPQLMKKELWIASGHWEHYKENMFLTMAENHEYAIKPMNCPGSILVYKTKRHSYRELPLKLAEFGIVHRKELSGVLNGLFRVRKFTQDDAHIYCSEEQVKEQVQEIIDLMEKVYKVFGFREYSVELSTKPEKAMGAKETWEKAEQALKDALNGKKIKFSTNEGEGAFYGPKIDMHITDSLGRKWQLTTIQLDFQMPEKFSLTYIGSDDKEHTPVMIHRTILGSMERFMGILIEHYAGKFPLWLAPVQAAIIPISDKHKKYAGKTRQEILEVGIRVEIDDRKETVGYKVREAEMQHIPLILAVGDKETKGKSVAVRQPDGKLKTKKLKDFVKEILEKIAKKE